MASAVLHDMTVSSWGLMTGRGDRLRKDPVVVGSVTAKRIRPIWIRPNVWNSFTRQVRERILATADGCVGCVVVGDLRWLRAVRAFVGIWLGMVTLFLVVIVTLTVTDSSTARPGGGAAAVALLMLAFGVTLVGPAGRPSSS